MGFSTMTRSYKQNRALLDTKKTFDALNQHEKWNPKISKKRRTTFYRASPQLLRSIRKMNRKRKIRANKISLLAFLFSIFVVGIIMIWLFGMNI